MIAWLLTLLAFSAQSPGQPIALTMAQVEARLGQPGVYVYDVNVPELWESGHLPGAIHIDTPRIRRFLPRDRNVTLIFYCANRLCSASGAAAREALHLGYRNVYLMPEGIFGWRGSGRPTER
jgi:rhodanese-related sulfurtransferase